MVEKVQDSSLIIEIWQIKPELSPKKSHCVILLMDGRYFCTCNLLISFGIPCRHFYKVLRKNSQAKFHVKLINQCWYQNTKFNMTDNDLALLDTMSLVGDHTKVIFNEINLSMLIRFMESKYIQKNFKILFQLKQNMGNRLF